MLQIIIWMLCVYLVFKGKELHLIAASSPNDDKERQVRIARAWQVVSVIAAGLFFVLSFEQAASFPAVPDPFGYPPSTTG